MTYVDIARRVIKKRSEQDQDSATHPTIKPQPESLEDLLRDRAIELWSTAAGTLFLVADEADRIQVMERFGARCGEIYTAAEARQIIAVKDPAVVAEVHEWKRRFGGVVQDFRQGGSR